MFGLTLSTGASLLCHCPTPFTSKAFAKIVRQQVGPFVKRAFPDRERRTILLDGEPLLHAPESKSALRDAGLVVLPGWPAYSLDLKPQENAWPWTENQLRKKECKTDTSEAFKRKLKNVARQYPKGERLIQSMHKRMKTCIANNGGMTKS